MSPSGFLFELKASFEFTFDVADHKRLVIHLFSNISLFPTPKTSIDRIQEVFFCPLVFHVVSTYRVFKVSC